jgi:hypothetical protein
MSRSDAEALSYELAIELAIAPRYRHLHAPLDEPCGGAPDLGSVAPEQEQEPAAPHPPATGDPVAAARAWLVDRGIAPDRLRRAKAR